MNLPSAHSHGPDLSVIVPVYNAEKHLAQLTEQVFSLEKSGLRCQMVCVDDGSSDGSVAVLQDLAKRFSGLQIIEQTGNHGAGIARNVAWDHATGRYTIFFDADDILHGQAMVDAIKEMDGHPEVDVAVFAYRYEREAKSDFIDMNFEDRKTLDMILQGAPMAIGTVESIPRLLAFTNYPWNKIIRTEHYKREGMRFGKTKVNNDILGHWHSVLLAREIMVRSAFNCTHIVHPQGNNLTNSFGAERLMMFDALDETYTFLESHRSHRRRFAHHFWALAHQLVGWARPRLDPRFRQEFEARYSDLLRRIDLGDLARMRTRHSADLANSLVNHLTR